MRSSSCRAAGWATLQRDDAEVLHNMQAYLDNLLTGPPAAGSTAAQGWSTAQRMLVRAAKFSANSKELSQQS